MALLSRAKAFSLVETLTALAILALVSSSVVVVINRCMASVTDLSLRMQAFKTARENMEKLLVLNSVSEMVEYGTSEKNPNIQWQTVVEPFYEPLTSRMWVRAVCSADYTDTTGQVQTVELTHWLTSVTKKQVLDVLKQRQQEQLANQSFATAKEAADYAGVDEETIQQWVDNGMRLADDGSFLASELDFYKQSGGKPSIAARRQRFLAERGINLPPHRQGTTATAAETGTTAETGTAAETGTTAETGAGDGELICGYTMEELNQMSFDQLWEILKNWNGP